MSEKKPKPSPKPKPSRCGNCRAHTHRAGECLLGYRTQFLGQQFRKGVLHAIYGPEDGVECPCPKSQRALTDLLQTTLPLEDAR